MASRTTRLILAIAALSVVLAAEAGTRLEIGLGQCFYNQTHVGSWWGGSDYDSKSMSPGCGQLSLSDVFREGKRRDGWRAAWVSLGRAPLREVAWGGAGPQPHWTATGGGEFYGASLGAFTEWRGNWSPSLEAGIFAYRSQWHAVAVHHASGAVNTFSTPARYAMTLYIGAGAAVPLTSDLSLTFRAQIFPRIRSNTLESGGDSVGAKYADVVALTTGLQWEFK